MNIQEIPIDILRIDGGTQSRTAINHDTVNDYAEVMSEGDNLPPITVYFDGVDHWLADGYHRLHAHRKIGAVTIDAEVKTGTQLDARIHAWGANKGHGLPRTNADKRKAVLGMLADAPQMGDRAIARHVGVSDRMVNGLRASICESFADEPATRTVERGGKTYTQDTSGQKKAAAQKKAKANPAETTTATPRERDEAPSAATTAEPAQVTEPGAQAADDAERMGELACMLETALAENDAMAVVFEADDRLAELTKENKNLRALLRTANERISGLSFEKNEMTQEVKKLQRLVARLKKPAEQPA